MLPDGPDNLFAAPDSSDHDVSDSRALVHGSVNQTHDFRRSLTEDRIWGIRRGNRVVLATVVSRV